MVGVVVEQVLVPVFLEEVEESAGFRLARTAARTASLWREKEGRFGEDKAPPAPLSIQDFIKGARTQDGNVGPSQVQVRSEPISPLPT
jgi:hypothetical protein